MNDWSDEASYYPTKATVYIPASGVNARLAIRPSAGSQTVITRLGGGARTIVEAGADYYPTRLWIFPSKSGGECYVDPETVTGLRLLTIDDWHSSADPLGAANCWPGCGMCTNDPRFIQATGEPRGHVIPGAPPELCGPLEDVVEPRRIRFIFAWYDLWLGAYWDRQAQRLYLMVPMVGVAIDFGKDRCK